VKVPSLGFFLFFWAKVDELAQHTPTIRNVRIALFFTEENSIGKVRNKFPHPPPLSPERGVSEERGGGEGLTLDYILAPVGGGGLLSGTAMAAKYFSPSTVVIAGEPAGSDDTYRSLKSGKIEHAQSQTIADGLLTTVGVNTFPIIHEYVKEVITVTEEEIVAAMRLIWERMKIVVEPSAAVPFASVLKSKEKFKGKRVGIILSGGNVDLERAAKLFA